VGCWAGFKGLLGGLLKASCTGGIGVERLELSKGFEFYRVGLAIYLGCPFGLGWSKVAAILSALPKYTDSPSS
jgi:hypothetical protein